VPPVATGSSTGFGKRPRLLGDYAPLPSSFSVRRAQVHWRRPPRMVDSKIWLWKCYSQP
jgi:hypothetical protein